MFFHRALMLILEGCTVPWREFWSSIGGCESPPTPVLGMVGQLCHSVKLSHTTAVGAEEENLAKGLQMSISIMRYMR